MLYTSLYLQKKKKKKKNEKTKQNNKHHKNKQTKNNNEVFSVFSQPKEGKYIANKWFGLGDFWASKLLMESHKYYGRGRVQETQSCTQFCSFRPIQDPTDTVNTWQLKENQYHIGLFAKSESWIMNMWFLLNGSLHFKSFGGNTM